MELSRTYEGRERALVDFFTTTFTASEGAEEGAAVGGLMERLLAETAPDDLRVFIATEADAIIGAAIFSRLTFAGDDRTVFILAPMAVATARQKQGVGQSLLRHALTRLRDAGVDVAVTYGDPAFYRKVGFAPMSETEVPAPAPLSRPEGWLGQTLAGGEALRLAGPCACVAALDDPAVW